MKTFLLTTCVLASLLVTLAVLISPTSSVARADKANPDVLLAHYPAWVLNLLCTSNVYAPANPMPGRTIRFQTPVEINLNQVSQARQAMQNIEAMTSGAVTFRVVNYDPAIGIVMVAGDALTRDGEPGVGHVTSSRQSQSELVFKTHSNGVIYSRLYAHLGSAHRDYIVEGFRSFSIAEHEIAHALGLMEHFPGFTGIEGISLESLVTLTALYRLPPGMDMSKICTLP